MSWARREPWQECLRFLLSDAMPPVFELEDGAWLPRVHLPPGHWHDLYDGSGLTPAMIQEQQLRPVPVRMLAKPGKSIPWSATLLGYPVSGEVRSVLLIPFFDLADKKLGLVDFVRVKVYPPICDREGHTIKYLQRRGMAPRLYVVKRVADAVRASTEPLYLIEGEKKTMAVAQRGYAAVGFLGVEGWHAKGSRQLLVDFDLIPLAGRVVNLVPDGDVQTNDNVARGVEHFAEALDRRGARVRVVQLPAGVVG